MGSLNILGFYLAPIEVSPYESVVPSGFFISPFG